MDILLQQIINGLVLGSMYALIALGYTMVYGIIQLINFAHGEVLMIGVLTSWSIIGVMQEAMPGTPGWVILLIATLIACVVAAVLNFTIEKLAYRPLRNSPRTKPDPSNWSPNQVPSGRSSSALQAPAMRAVGVISSASDKVVTLCGMVTRAPLRLVTRASAASGPA